jgi:hypothetical protein
MAWIHSSAAAGAGQQLFDYFTAVMMIHSFGRIAIAHMSSHPKDRAKECNPASTDKQFKKDDATPTTKQKHKAYS